MLSDRSSILLISTKNDSRAFGAAFLYLRTKKLAGAGMHRYNKKIGKEDISHEVKRCSEKIQGGTANDSANT